MERRNTKQRQEIYDIVAGVGKHMTADEVYKVLKKKNSSIGIATVYRNLNLLYENGLIGRIVAKDTVIYDGNVKPHHHVRCVQCGEYHDIDLPYDSSLNKKIKDKYGIEVLKHEITFDYLCDKCKKKDKN